MLQEKDNELQNLLHKFNLEERAQLPAKISSNQDDMPHIRKDGNFKLVFLKTNIQ